MNYNDKKNRINKYPKYTLEANPVDPLNKDKEQYYDDIKGKSIFIKEDLKMFINSMINE